MNIFYCPRQVKSPLVRGSWPVGMLAHCSARTSDNRSKETNHLSVSLEKDEQKEDEFGVKLTDRPFLPLAFPSH